MKNLFLLLLSLLLLACSDNTATEEQKSRLPLVIYSNNNSDDGNDNNNQPPEEDYLGQPLDVYVDFTNQVAGTSAQFDEVDFPVVEYNETLNYVGIARSTDVSNAGNYIRINLKTQRETSTGEYYLYTLEYGADVEPNTPEGDGFSCMNNDPSNPVVMINNMIDHGHPTFEKDDEVAIITYYHPDDRFKATPLDRFSIRI